MLFGAFPEEGFTVINSYYLKHMSTLSTMPRRKQSGYGRLFHLLSLIKKYASQIMGGEFCAWEEHP